MSCVPGEAGYIKTTSWSLGDLSLVHVGRWCSPLFLPHRSRWKISMTSWTSPASWPWPRPTPPLRPSLTPSMTSASRKSDPTTRPTCEWAARDWEEGRKVGVKRSGGTSSPHYLHSRAVTLLTSDAPPPIQSPYCPSLVRTAEV